MAVKVKSIKIWPLTSKSDLDLWHRVKSCTWLVTNQNEHFYQVLWRYKLMKFMPGQDINNNIVTSKSDLELRHKVRGLVCDMPTYQSEHFYHVSWRYNNNLWSHGPDKIQFTTFWPLMSLVLYSTCLFENFCQISWRYINQLWSYGPAKVLITKCWPSPSKCDLDL